MGTRQKKASKAQVNPALMHLADRTAFPVNPVKLVNQRNHGFHMGDILEMQHQCPKGQEFKVYKLAEGRRVTANIIGVVTMVRNKHQFLMSLFGAMRVEDWRIRS